MTYRRICAVCFVLWMAASAQAVTIPADLPAISITTQPQTPGPSQPFSLILSGQWPDSCTPESIDLRVVNGDSLWIDLLLPGARTCNEPNCTPATSGWQINSTVSPLAAGAYYVYARAVACNRTGEFERIGILRVGPGGGNGGKPIDREFAVGDRVVLLENSPLGIVDLLLGQTGTVVCVGATDCSECLLISWDGWVGGRDDAGPCPAADQPALFPPESAVWIDPDGVLIGRHFNQCGTIRQGLEGCILLETDDGKVFNIFGDGWLGVILGETGPIHFGDRVRVRGSLNRTLPAPDVIRTCPQRDGDIYYPIVTRCAPAGGDGCCAGTLRTGDRVVLLVNNPAGADGGRATNLPAGSRGTVVCCDSGDPQFPLFVSWDGWREGTNDDFYCDPPVVSYPDNSGWWMRCGQISLPDGGEPEPCPDDGLIVNIGSQTIRLIRDPLCPNPIVFSGCANVALEANFRARLSVRVVPATGVDGDWEGWVTPEVVGPGAAAVKVCVRVRNLDLGTLPPGKDVPVASLSILAVPTP